MKKKALNIALIVILAVVMLAGFYPAYYWFKNPEMTRMEIFKQWWFVEIAVIFLAQYILRLLSDKK